MRFSFLLLYLCIVDARLNTGNDINYVNKNSDHKIFKRQSRRSHQMDCILTIKIRIKAHKSEKKRFLDPSVYYSYI